MVWCVWFGSGGGVVWTINRKSRWLMEKKGNFWWEHTHIFEENPTIQFLLLSRSKLPKPMSPKTPQLSSIFNLTHPTWGGVHLIMWCLDEWILIEVRSVHIMFIKWMIFWVFHCLPPRVWSFLKHQIHQIVLANMLLKVPLDIVCNHVFKDVKPKKYGWLTLDICFQTSFDGTQSLRQWNTSSSCVKHHWHIGEVIKFQWCRSLLVGITLCIQSQGKCCTLS